MKKLVINKKISNKFYFSTNNFINKTMANVDSVENPLAYKDVI